MNDEILSELRKVFDETDDAVFAKKLADLYGEVLDSRKDSDYVVNDEQMGKLIEALRFFKDEAKENDGMDVEPIKLVPKKVHSGVEVTFEVFDLSGERLEKFNKILGYASAFGIDTTVDGRAGMGITIPNVFVPKGRD